MAKEKMSSVDQAWLRMDSPENLMMIVGVQVFDKPVAYKTLVSVVQERLLKFKRFKQIVVTDTAGAWWVTAKNFILSHTLFRTGFLALVPTRNCKTM